MPYQGNGVKSLTVALNSQSWKKKLSFSLFLSFFIYLDSTLMITPTFKVDQDNDAVHITINTPYVRVSWHCVFSWNRHSFDMWVFRLKMWICMWKAASFDSICVLTFWGEQRASYARHTHTLTWTRLHFPGNIVEDDDSKAVYDPSAGQFNIRVTKETKGEHFADLDLLTKLLARTGETTAASNEPKKPLIEVVGGVDNDPMNEEQIQDAIDFNWELPQEVPSTDEQLSITTQYGFNNQYSGYFTHVHESMNEINEVNEPEKSTVESRREQRIASENTHFDEDHYCMDYVNDEEIKELCKYKTVYAKELKRVQKNQKTEEAKQAKSMYIHHIYTYSIHCLTKSIRAPDPRSQSQRCVWRSWYGQSIYWGYQGYPVEV